MEYRLCDDPWNEMEIQAIERVIDSKMYTMGENVCEFEKRFADKMGVKYAVMTNSGSTANLLAVAALIYSKRINRGDEIVVPAVSWSTTYAPLEQYGLKLRFVDIDHDTLNISIDELKKAITNNTKMLFAVNLLGNPNEYNEIKKICGEKGIIIVEDNCEALGGKYKNQYLGTLGLIGTFSTFYSHHICTMEGGVAVTNDRELYEYMLAIRAHGWTRNLPDDSIIYSKRTDQFYESFNFIVPGYNLRPLDMEGAIGIEQLKKMDRMISQRRRNADYFVKLMKTIGGCRIQKEIGESSWFGFAIVLEQELIGKRDTIVKLLREKQIECRPIVAGNFTRNKVVEYFDYEIAGTLINADDIHENGFFIGNHTKNNEEEVTYFVDTLSHIIKGLK